MHNLTPDFILHQTAQDQHNGEFDAVVLFVDTSGFTPLIVRLAEHGRHGSEVLADILQAVFEPLVAAIYTHGGYIAGFAGDAFKAIFTGLSTESYRNALAAAEQALSHIRNHPTHTTRYGDFDFTMRASIADGRVTWAVWSSDVADASQSRGYTFSGPALDAAILGEDLANGGELVVTQSVFDMLRTDGVDGTALGDEAISKEEVSEEATGYLRVNLLSASSTLFTIDSEKRDEAEAELITGRQDDSSLLSFESTREGFYPHTLLNTAVRGEFRAVYSVFVNVQSLPDPGSDTDFLPRFFQLLHQYGGYLCRIGRIGANDPGGTFLLFWGAPTGHENDLMRVLSFLLALRSQINVPLRAGVTHGTVYAGFVGSSMREEYTCYGRSVPQAARQMVLAEWGQILLDAATANRAEYDFRIGLVGHFSLKGLPKPQPLFTLADEQIQQRPANVERAFVGRADEINQLGEAIQPVLDGRFGGLTLISGEAGIGKSRLVHQALRTVQQAGKTEQLQVFLCQTDEILRESLNPFRYFLRRYFDQLPTADVNVNKANFDAKLNELIASTAYDGLGDELTRTRSFLGALINLYWDNSLYARLEPQLRFENTLAALKTLFRAESRRQPTVILLEDAHWLDEDSRVFLTRLTRNVDDAALTIWATTRPVEEAAPLPPEIVTNAIAIVPLSPSDVRGLAEQHLGGAVTPELCDLLFARAGGNPFFAEQMLLYLQEEDLLFLDEGGWRLAERAGPSDGSTETRLPTDVQTVLIARLDRLSQEVKQVVQTAAVLGREFSVQVLSEMLRNDLMLNDKVQSAQESAVWDALSELRYLFRHALLRDAAYEMQLRAQLRELHQTAAEAIETTFAGNLSLYYADLVNHYREAELPTKEVIYAQLAGERAASRFENQDALLYLARALTLTAQDDFAQRYDLHVKRVKVLNVLAQRADEETELQTLQQVVEQMNDVRRRIEVALLNVDYHMAVSQYDAGEQTMRTALADAQQHEDLLADIHIRWSHALILKGEFDAAKEHLQAAEELVAGGDPRQRADVYYYLGLAASQKGDSQVAETHLVQAIPIYRELGDPIQEGQALQILGLSYRGRGESAIGIGYIREAQEIWRGAGFRRGEMMAIGNIGHGYLDQGNYVAAQRQYRQAMQLAIEAQDSYVQGATLQNVALTTVELGDYAAAIPLYEEALELYRSVKTQGYFFHTMSNLALLYVDAGDFERALAIATESVDGLYAMNADALVGLPHYIRGRALLGLRRFDEAHESYEQARPLLEGRPHHLVEVSAAQIELGLARGDVEDIRYLLEDILTYLADDPTGVGHLTYVYAVVYRALTALDDSRATVILQTAYDYIESRAALIDDERLKHSYRENVPSHRELLREAARQA